MAVQVAVAGATGAVGIPVVVELLKAGHFVTALTRSGRSCSAKLPKHHPHLSTAEVDYDSVASLTAALQGHAVVIAALPGATPIGSQDTLIDAAVAAGVIRFLPAEFGTDTNNDNCMKLPTRSQITPVSATRLYALVRTGSAAGFLVHPKAHTATIYDDGNLPFSTTILSTISEAVASIIDHLEETKNRHVYIHDAVIAQNKLIGFMKRIIGKDWQLTYIDSSVVSAEGQLEFQKPHADINTGLMPLLHISVLGKGYGGDFSGHLDNELLGIKEMSDEELEDVIARFL
ncbi:NAD(P)-binding protein [Trichoderma citrinoviride]|uniref:NAD(P)-binding protein n=1 Tax=Trichoderma citrinoviride TaxID=58853 RepID=A0A2T4BGQ1_9HYPO|nr:NAD(P)-binding protein [Trichoderma citrinoviride]PTB68419.1 NAD(P)-binding protein [Trichoderma citrinoviride]